MLLRYDIKLVTWSNSGRYSRFDHVLTSWLISIMLKTDIVFKRKHYKYTFILDLIITYDMHKFFNLWTKKLGRLLDTAKQLFWKADIVVALLLVRTLYLTVSWFQPMCIRQGNFWFMLFWGEINGLIASSWNPCFT